MLNFQTISLKEPVNHYKSYDKTRIRIEKSDKKLFRFLKKSSSILKFKNVNSILQTLTKTPLDFDTNLHKHNSTWDYENSENSANEKTNNEKWDYQVRLRPIQTQHSKQWKRPDHLEAGV